MLTFRLQKAAIGLGRDMSPSSCTAGWTDERVATLKKLWLQGFSCSQIAKQLGGTTRNAVIGKVSRLGLHGRAPPSAPAAGRYKAPKVPRRVRSQTASARNVGREARSDGTPVSVLPPKPIVEKVVEAAGAPLMLSVLQLGAHTCKWPIGDPASDGFGFCGHSCSEGPYCEAHAAVSVNTNAKKQSTSSLEKMFSRVERRWAA